jgi:hypothetical protein
MPDAPTGLLPALLAVQAEAPTLPKNATNPHYKSKFCPLDTIVETIGPLLVKNGLVWTTLPGVNEHGQPSLTYRLLHIGGESIQGTMPLLLSKEDAQGQGSAITYARRYAICAVLNLVADDDDDGHRAAVASQGGQRDGGLASAAQKKFLRTLLTQNRIEGAPLKRLFESVDAACGKASRVTPSSTGSRRGSARSSSSS